MMNIKVAGLGAIIICLCAGCLNMDRVFIRGVTLARDGHTAYTIIQPETVSAVDAFALKELTTFLEESTGAVFMIKPPDQNMPGRHRIFVGLSEPARKILGTAPLAGMSNQTHVVRTIGDDVFLYGKGPHGNLYAVYDFLETSVGCRWFSAFGGMKIPRHPVLRIQALNRRLQPAMQYRYGCAWAYLLRPDSQLFLYRNRVNLGVEEQAMPYKGCEGITDAAASVPPGVHTVFAYIPPHEKPSHGINPPLNFLANKNYFITNPEFFSMDTRGNRSDSMQLCFSNKELRRTLTENVVENIKRHGGKGIVTVDANDRPGHFCHCPPCGNLEKKYASIGGPLYDYLLELSAYLETDYPDVFVKFLAYRKEQTQTPPKIDRLPDNLVVIFAPIDDNFAADFNHPTNIGTYRDLEQWCRLTQNVWPWYYPNPYVAGGYPPFGNVERLVNDIRLMQKAGCNGAFFEHDVGVTMGTDFSELQTYLMVKLWQSPGQDAGALIAEFMDAQYGQAAVEMRRFLDELEAERKAMPNPITWNPSCHQFRYLTPDNLHRWEQAFDRMERMTATQPACRFNVQMTRLNLDVTVLRTWRNCTKAHPDYFNNYDALEQRVLAVNEQAAKERASPNMVGFMNARKTGLVKHLKRFRFFSENPGKPLPEQFAGLDEDRIRRVVPTSCLTGQTNDTDAAFGVAAISVSEKPFHFGFYDEFNRKFVLSRALQLSDIKPDRYHYYKLGTVQLTPSCQVWLANRSWAVSARLDEFYEPGVSTRWEIHVSMKFEGPSFSEASRLREDRVRCDQIVLVKDVQ